jgi:hypothetical protein
MKPTTKIRFTEPQIALVMRAHPNCNLDNDADELRDAWFTHRLWFRWVDGITNSTSKLAPGVDVRGAGGYVMRRSVFTFGTSRLSSHGGASAGASWLSPALYLRRGR